MRHISAFFLVLIFFLSMVTLVSAHPGLEEGHEHIQKFDQRTWINTDGSIKVEEQIVYDFGHDDRHGIFRTIPTIKSNTENKKYRLKFEVENVVDDKGNEYIYEVNYEGDTLNIKIGDPDSTITGIHTYIITYTVHGGLTYFSDHDELYWNVTGNDWTVPIAKVSSTIYLPKSVPVEKIKASCYSGYQGSTEQQCVSSIQGVVTTTQSVESLGSGEGITTVVGFPKGIVSIVEPEEVKDFSTTFLGKVLIALAILALILWYLLLPIWLPIKWFMQGRDPRGTTGQVQAWFDPPKTKTGRALTPAETGTLIDEHASIREISAVIVNLAQRGYLKIVQKDKEFEFIKTKDYSLDESLIGFEKTLLNELFAGTDTLNLKDAKLATGVAKVQNMLYEDLVKEGYFPENPDKIRKKYMVLAGIAAFTFNFFLLVTASIFGRLMPRKTLDGVHATNVAKSIKNFLTSQERQLEFQAKNQLMFEKLLPFAVAFGVEKIWAERFKDIALTPPDWFVSTQSTAFNSQIFTSRLASSMSAFSTAATPVSSSTGHSSGFSGGSSGGGGGGGGGGSW